MPKIPSLRSREPVSFAPVSRARPEDKTAPPLRPTTAEERARLGPKHAGSAIAETMIEQKDPLDLSALPHAAVEALRAAFDAAKGSERGEVRRGLELIASSPIADRLAVHVITGQRLNKIKPRDVELLAGAAKSPKEIARAIALWARRHDVENGLAGVRGELANPLRAAMMAGSDAPLVRKALAFIERFMKAEGDSSAIATLLVDAGCLPATGKWTDAHAFAPGSDPLGVLAARLEGGLAVRPAAIEAWKAALAPLASSAKWKHVEALSNHRGMVGEALRMGQLEKSEPGRLLVQGIIVVSVPPGLESARSLAEADAWCLDHGKPTGSVWRFEAADGPRFGFRETEIDAAVFDTSGGGLRPVRFENVKAGTGSAGTARKQNERAKNALASGHGLLLFPTETGLVDRTPELTGDPNAIALLTVGPAGDPGYDVELPLTAGDLTRLTRALRQDPS